MGYSKEEKHEYGKLYYYMNKRNERCTKCGAELDNHTLKCSACREKANAYYHKPENKKRNAEKNRKKKDLCIAFGVCITCKRRDAVHGKTRCQECIISDNKRKEEKRREKGVLPRHMFGNGTYCLKCGKPVEIKGNKQCNLHTRQSIKALEYARSRINLDNRAWDDANKLIFYKPGRQTT